MTNESIDSIESITMVPSAANSEQGEALSAGLKLVTLLAVILPFVGLLATIVLLWGTAFSLAHLFVFIGMYVLTGIGVTVGFHRLFTHRSFATFKPVRWTLGILGSMALEGPVMKWVAQHRRHHQLSDHAGDPHSPHLSGHAFVGFVRGLYHAHMGWLFSPDYPNLQRYVGDLRQERGMWVISKLFVLWAALGLVIPAALGGLLTQSWMGVLLGFVWGGLTRIFLIHHVTWSINSVCHIWGWRTFPTTDQSRNNPVLGVLAMGEGWHNNHHAFPNSARHGLRWWELDASYGVIRLMSWLGLAWNVRVPDAQQLAAKRGRAATL